jgi:hypothetical protein
LNKEQKKKKSKEQKLMSPVTLYLLVYVYITHNPVHRNRSEPTDTQRTALYQIVLITCVI